MKSINFDKASGVYSALCKRVTEYERQSTSARRAGEREDAQEYDDLATSCSELAAQVKSAIDKRDEKKLLKLVPTLKALLGPIDVFATEEVVSALRMTTTGKDPSVAGTYVALYANPASAAHVQAIQTLLGASKHQAEDADKFAPHITIMYSPEHGATSLGKFKTALAEFAAKSPTVTCTVGGAKYLGKRDDALVLSLTPGPDVMWLRDLCVASGMKATWPDFTPHMTLAYDLVLDDAGKAALLAKANKLVEELEFTTVMFNAIVVEDIKE